MEEYIKAQTLPELTEAEVLEIDKAGVQLHSRQFVSLAGYWPSLPSFYSPKAFYR